MAGVAFHGTRPDGGRLEMVGVTRFGVNDGRIVWGRFYVEPVQSAGAIEDSVECMIRGETGV